MSADNILFQVATWLIPLVIAIVLHEIAHGWVALAFGDPTAKRKRRLSLNPLRHVDPFGTVVLPLALAVAGAPVFGWAKPVPVVARRLRNPRVHMMLVSLAGPGMNLLLAILGAFAWAGLRWLQPPEGLGWDFLILNVLHFVLINVSLAIFNLLPIPPFDGGHVVEGLLPRPLAQRYARLGRYGFPILVLLLVVLPMAHIDLVGGIIEPPIRLLLGLLGVRVA
ncbi:MAG: site-2 protease family protein [Sphingomonadaceae bacterium]|nr:site-2 protease family protein [Sphingomonadaceae bacterium]